MSDKPQISRRDVLAVATMVVGGAVAGITPLALAEQWVDGDAAAAPVYLDPDRLLLLEAVANTIIPSTDTPGAVDAGVPGFIDFLLSAWASDQTRRAFSEGMDGIRQRAAQVHGRPFTELDGSQREAVLTALDQEYLGRPRDGFGLIKNLVVFGYYTSEPGATLELQWDQIPGAYGCRPMSKDQRDWATNGWRNEL